jgi:DNA-binding NarL/FixJ family response regulator
MMLVYLFVRPSLRRKDPLTRPGGSSLSQERSVERQMQNLLVELSEMTRQISAQLDTRAAKLELLIREADEKIDRLQTTMRSAASTDAIAPRTGSESPLDSAPTSTIDPRHARIYELVDAGQTVSQIAQSLNRPSGEVELILALRPKA